MIRLDEILVDAGLSASKTAARNLIKGDAVVVNDYKVTDPYASVGLQGSSIIVFEFDTYFNVGELLITLNRD